MTLSMEEKKRIQLDRMRYTKNVLSSRLTYLAILFDVLYFVSIFSSDVGSWYYKMLVGGSIVYNLVFMLMAFLASEGVKAYKQSYAWLLLALGATPKVPPIPGAETAYNIFTVFGSVRFHVNISV